MMDNTLCQTCNKTLRECYGHTGHTGHSRSLHFVQEQKIRDIVWNHTILHNNIDNLSNDDKEIFNSMLSSKNIHELNPKLGINNDNNINNDNKRKSNNIYEYNIYEYNVDNKKYKK